MRTPYERAYAAYHSMGPPELPWAEVIARHLCHGVVISTPDCFLAARAVPHAAPDSEHHAIPPAGFPASLSAAPDCWHIWIAAGDLAALLRLVSLAPMPWVSYCRRGSSEVRRLQISSSHVPESQSPAHAAAAATTGILHGIGESQSGLGSAQAPGQRL